jgi:hypothetical protein
MGSNVSIAISLKIVAHVSNEAVSNVWTPAVTYAQTGKTALNAV